MRSYIIIMTGRLGREDEHQPCIEKKNDISSTPRDFLLILTSTSSLVNCPRNMVFMALPPATIAHIIMLPSRRTLTLLCVR